MITVDCNEQKGYRRLMLKEPLKSVAFLIKTLGFEQAPDTGELGICIHDKQGNYFKLVPDANANSQELVLIYTDDCLNNYFELKTSGIITVNKPQYSSEGLSVEFSDSWGNYYKILEERFYDEHQ